MTTRTETKPSAERCPVCGEPMPEQSRDRHVSYRGTVVCSGKCAQRDNDEAR